MTPGWRGQDGPLSVPDKILEATYKSQEIRTNRVPNPAPRPLGAQYYRVLELLPPLTVGSIPTWQEVRVDYELAGGGPHPYVTNLTPKQVPEPHSIKWG